LPYQPVTGQLRPYVAPALPVTESHPFNFILDTGMQFDLTIEEGQPQVPPGGDDTNRDYVYSGIGFLQNSPSLGGGVPSGWHFSLPAAIQNVQPAIESVPACGGFLSDPHPSAPLYCQGQTTL
jgi:hypothetical protein